MVETTNVRGVGYEAGGTQTVVSQVLRALCVFCTIHILAPGLPHPQILDDFKGQESRALS